MEETKDDSVDVRAKLIDGHKNPEKAKEKNMNIRAAIVHIMGDMV